MSGEPRRNPFPGLRPFETEEQNLFFGREGQSERILRRLRENRFLAVVGTSGSGKSSLIRAGLLPYLHGGFMAQAGSHWRTAIFRPGSDPIGNLARALNDPAVLGAGDDDPAKNAILLEVTLRRSGLGLIDAVRLARFAAWENILVVVDQFEELFRFADPTSPDREDDAAAFVKLLLEAAGQNERPVFVALTMRSDFIGECARFQDLPEAVTAGLYLIPRMTREQMREAIEGPIKVAGAEISPRLLNRLLNDVGDNPDQLPILQHALMRTWDDWEKRHEGEQPIDLEHYAAIGAMSEALSRHADEAYAELPSDRYREIARRLFQCLTERGPDNREVRRPTAVAEIAASTDALTAEVITVIECFRRPPDRSFLMPPASVALDANSIIDISHESLIRCWTRLNEWVEAESRSAKTYLWLAEAAVRCGKGEGSLLHGRDLLIALAWRDSKEHHAGWAQRYHAEFEPAMAFLEKSRAAEQAEADTKRREAEADLADKERRRKEQLRRWRLGAVAALVTIVTLGFLALSLVYQKRDFKIMAQVAADNARKADVNAREADSLRATAVSLAFTYAAIQKSKDQKDPLDVIIGHINDAIDLWKPLAGASGKPDLVGRIVDQGFWLYVDRGDLQRSRSGYAEAEQDYTRADELAQRLDGNTDDGRYDRLVASERFGTLWRYRAEAEADAGKKKSDLEEAKKRHEIALAANLDWSRTDKSVARKRSVAIDEYNVGRDYFLLGDYDNARRYYKDEIRYYDEVNKAPRNSHDDAVNLASAYEDVEDVESAAKNYAPAWEATSQRVLILRKLADDKSATSEDKRRAAVAFGSRSWFDLFVGKIPLAETDADAGLQYDLRQVWIFSNKAHSYLFRGRADDAIAIYEKYANEVAFPDSSDRKAFLVYVLADFATFKEYPGLSQYRSAIDDVEQKLRNRLAAGRSIGPPPNTRRRD